MAVDNKNQASTNEATNAESLNSAIVKRVAILLPNLFVGGAERVSLTLAEEFINRGILVDILLLKSVGPLLSRVPQGVRVINLDQQRLFKSFFPLLRYLRSNRPSGLIANIWPLTLVATLAGWFANKALPVIAIHQNSLSLQYVDSGKHSRFFMKLCLRLELARARAVVGCSAGVVADLCELSGYSAEKFVVQVNPVKIAGDLSPTEMSAVEKLWVVPHGGRILAVGNLKPQKNLALLIDAFAALQTVLNRKTQLIIIGEGDLRPKLEKQIAGHGLQHRVLMPGQSNCVEAFYRSADLYAMSSDYEGLPTVLVEALGSGLSVVSTDCPSGPREILLDGKFGRLVPVGNSQYLSEAMRDVLLKPFEPAYLKSRASQFAPSKICSKYIDLLGLA